MLITEKLQVIWRKTSLMPDLSLFLHYYCHLLLFGIFFEGISILKGKDMGKLISNICRKYAKLALIAPLAMVIAACSDL